MFFFEIFGNHRDLHVLTPTCPTRWSSDPPDAAPRQPLVDVRGHAAVGADHEADQAAARAALTRDDAAPLGVRGLQCRFTPSAQTLPPRRPLRPRTNGRGRP